MDLLLDLFHVLLVVPMTNVLVAIAAVFGGNFGLAIIAFTLLMKLVTWPLTASQYKMTKAMQAMQPKMQELQKKYKGKDPKKLQAETMALYREHGVNPLGCLLPMLVQIPIWFALYRVIVVTVGDAPESLVDLSQTLYPIEFIHSAVPLSNTFLFWNLGQPDTTLVLPLLTAVSMYVQQKMITPAPSAATANSQQQQTQQMMTWMMPLIFGFWSLQVPSGLALYWAVSNISGIALQYFYMGRRIDWKNMLTLVPAPAPAPAARTNRPAPEKAAPAAQKQDQRDGAVDDGTAADEGEPVPATTGGQSSRRKRHGRRRGKR
jgi:YidC/Oxa1 family membrane protein insertase